MFRNTGNLGKRVYNTVGSYIIATLQCFQNAFSGKNFRLVLVHPTRRYLQLIYSTEPRFLMSDLLLVLHNEPVWPQNTGFLWCDLGIIRVVFRHVLLTCVAVAQMSSHSWSAAWWLRRWRCSIGLFKLDVSCAVASSCCFSLTFCFRCVISVHTVYSYSPYVKLSNIWNCQIAITILCGLRNLYPKCALSLTL